MVCMANINTAAETGAVEQFHTHTGPAGSYQWERGTVACLIWAANRSALLVSSTQDFITNSLTQDIGRSLTGTLMLTASKIGIVLSSHPGAVQVFCYEVPVTGKPEAGNQFHRLLRRQSLPAAKTYQVPGGRCKNANQWKDAILPVTGSWEAGRWAFYNDNPASATYRGRRMSVTIM